MDDNDFLGDASLPIADGEEIPAVHQSLHRILMALADFDGFQFERIDKGACQAVHLYIQVTLYIVELQSHLSVVGIGNDTDRGRVGFLLFHAIE